MKNKGKKIADEVWIMLPDSCKEIMKGIKKTFKDSIEADVNDLFIVKSNKKCECKQAKEMHKQEIIEAYSEGYVNGIMNKEIRAVQYYSETYNK